MDSRASRHWRRSARRNWRGAATAERKAIRNRCGGYPALAAEQQGFADQMRLLAREAEKRARGNE